MSNHNSEPQIRVIYQESPRDYRTEIPNIIFQMLEQGIISPSDLVLYSVYRRIAGQEGACWVGNRGLEKRCALNHKTIAKSKKSLSKRFAFLGGKSLIQITPGDYASGEADTITIIDVWPENFVFFKKTLPDPKEPQGCSKRAPGVWKKSPTKNEPSKKEPSKKESKGSGHSPRPPKVSPDSIPSYSEGYSIDSTSQMVELLELEPRYLPFFRPNIVARWIKKFGAALVLETVEFFLQVKSTQNKPIPNPEAWMESAFKNKYAEMSKNSLENKKFAEDLKRKYRATTLKINKRYCQETETGQDFYYHLPKETFQQAIIDIIKHLM